MSLRAIDDHGRYSGLRAVLRTNFGRYSGLRCTQRPPVLAGRSAAWGRYSGRTPRKVLAGRGVGGLQSAAEGMLGRNSRPASTFAALTALKAASGAVQAQAGLTAAAVLRE